MANLSLLQIGLLSASALALVSVAALAAFLALRRARRTRARRDFTKAQGLGYADYEKAYSAASAKLGKDWNLIEIVHDLSE